MFNVGGGELLVILFLALIVLGPQRLPDAAKQIGKFMGEMRRMSSGFQQELRAALDEPAESAALAKGAELAASTAEPPATPTPPAARRSAPLKAAPVAEKAPAKKAPAKKKTAATKAAAPKKRA